MRLLQQIFTYVAVGLAIAAPIALTHIGAETKQPETGLTPHHQIMQVEKKACDQKCGNNLIRLVDAFNQQQADVDRRRKGTKKPSSLSDTKGPKHSHGRIVIVGYANEPA